MLSDGVWQLLIAVRKIRKQAKARAFVQPNSISEHTPQTDAKFIKRKYLYIAEGMPYCFPRPVPAHSLMLLATMRLLALGKTHVPAAVSPDWY